MLKEIAVKSKLICNRHTPVTLFNCNTSYTKCYLSYKFVNPQGLSHEGLSKNWIMTTLFYSKMELS